MHPLNPDKSYSLLAGRGRGRKKEGRLNTSSFRCPLPRLSPPLSVRKNSVEAGRRVQDRPRRRTPHRVLVNVTFCLSSPPQLNASGEAGGGESVVPRSVGRKWVGGREELAGWRDSRTPVSAWPPP